MGRLYMFEIHDVILGSLELSFVYALRDKPLFFFQQRICPNSIRVYR